MVAHARTPADKAEGLGYRPFPLALYGISVVQRPSAENPGAQARRRKH